LIRFLEGIDAETLFTGLAYACAARGRRCIASGRPVTLIDINMPVFAVGTKRDHVAPWHSTYKINQQVESEVTYVLTSGGHNAGRF
jgi:poly(3-hydroxyalkanoate) synthetase